MVTGTTDAREGGLTVRIQGIALALCMLLCLGARARAEATPYRFAGAKETAVLLLSHRDYYEGMSQDDLNFRLQRTGATLAELERFAAAQARDFTDAETAAVDAAMAFIDGVCEARGYRLPPLEEIVFCKTTMREECGAGGYTHGNQIYLGARALGLGTSESEGKRVEFRELVAHELFHCLTRADADFRRELYALLGFAVADEPLPLSPAIRQRLIANPDVERHDAYAAFELGGEMRDCVVVFILSRPFRRSGDSFFELGRTGLVPLDDPTTLYDADTDADLWSVFGRNTDYVIDPEEVLADNFGDVLIHGPGGKAYATPALIDAIDACLRGRAD